MKSLSKGIKRKKSHDQLKIADKNYWLNIRDTSIDQPNHMNLRSENSRELEIKE